MASDNSYVGCEPTKASYRGDEDFVLLTLHQVSRPVRTHEYFELEKFVDPLESSLEAVSAGRTVSRVAGRILSHVDGSYSAVFSGLVEGSDSI